MSQEDPQTATVQIVPEEENSADSATPELDSLDPHPQNRYRFIRSIGFGGMKAVLLVHDHETARDVAMAIMPDFRERPKQDLERFVREARLTASLEHPNIVPVYDIGIDSSGSPFFTMKYLRGMPLDTMIRRIANGETDVKNYTLDRLLLVFLRVCNAVDFAHSRRICHLDLKPSNINIGDFGEVQVLDWGLARKTDRFGQVISDAIPSTRGTPGFVAPEYINHSPDKVLDIRADIFALGGLLYSLLALHTPLSGRPVEEILRRTTSGDVPPPSKVAPRGRIVPRALEAIAMKAMAPNPGDRYNSVAEIKAEIRAFNSGFAPEAEHPSPSYRLLLFFVRNYLLVIIAVLSGLLIYLLLKMRFS